MSAPNLGSFNTATTRTHVGFQFSTHAQAGANIAPLSSIDAADIRIYRAADGAAFSATQRSSANGITCTSPFDSLTGVHDVDIDLTDNTDSGFYAAGYRYSVMLAPDTETVDGQTITGVVLAYFEIGPPPVNVAQWLGTAPSTPTVAGVPNVNAKTWNDLATVALPLIPATPGRSLVVDAAGLADANAVKVGPTGSGTAQTARDLGNALPAAAPNASGGLLTFGSSTGQVNPSSGKVPATLASTDVTGNVAADLQTIKTQGVTCAAGVTVLASVGTAATSTAQTGDGYAILNNGTYGLSALKTLLDAIAGYIDTEVAAIKAKTDNLPSDPADASDVAASFSSIASTLSTIAGYIDTEVAAIKAKTDNLPAAPAATSDIPSASTVAAAVWDLATSGHVTAGTFGAQLKTLLDTVAGYIDTEVAAIKAKTDNLPSDPADASDIAASFSSIASTLSTIAGYIDTEVAAIKAKTDNLPASPAATSDIISAATIAAAVWDLATSGHVSSGTFGAQLKTIVDAIAGYLDTEVAAIKAKTDTIPAAPAAVGDIPTAVAIVAALFAAETEDSETFVETVRVMRAMLVGKSDGFPAGPHHFRDKADSKDRVTLTSDADGNRLTVTTNAA